MMTRLVDQVTIDLLETGAMTLKLHDASHPDLCFAALLTPASAVELARQINVKITEARMLTAPTEGKGQ